MVARQDPRGGRSVGLYVRVSERQLALIRRAAEREGITVSQHVRDAALIHAADTLGLDPLDVLGDGTTKSPAPPTTP